MDDQQGDENDQDYNKQQAQPSQFQNQVPQPQSQPQPQPQPQSQPVQFQVQFQQNPQVYQQPSSVQYQQGYNQNPPQMVQPNMMAPGPANVRYPQMQQNLGTEGWNTELFGCLENPENAVITALFPCVTFGQIAEIIDNGNSSCTTQAVMYGAVVAFIGIPCIVSYSYRTRLRSQFQLMETPAPDWLTHFFCEPCALCQEYRELKSRGFDPSIGWQGNLALQQRNNIAMTPPVNHGTMHK